MNNTKFSWVFQLLNKIVVSWPTSYIYHMGLFSSAFFYLLFGVLKILVLIPPLFNISINDRCKVVEFLNYLPFAADIKNFIRKSFHGNFLIQSYLNSICCWRITYFMKISIKGQELFISPERTCSVWSSNCVNPV